MARMPFTWNKLVDMFGNPIGKSQRDRIASAIAHPGTTTWANARTIIVAGNLSGMGMTLWQCVEHSTMQRYPADRVPDGETIKRALCYATAELYVSYDHRRR